MEQQLKDLGLTEKDFDMLVVGLEELPNKGAAGEMLGDMLMASLIPDGLEKDQMEEKRKADKAQAEHEKSLLLEDIRVLQGKLITMKRFLIENKLMHSVDESLNA